MADLYLKQAKEYSSARPSYPEDLFQFIASKTSAHNLVWDVGTGSGQAAKSLAAIYKKVVGTDTSPNQLELAVKHPNIRYYCSPPNMSLAEPDENVAAESSVDLITVATALHWFDLPTFYQQAKYVLKKPSGVIAAWTYTVPEIDSSTTLNTLLHNIYLQLGSYLEPQAKHVLRDRYATVDFPFEPVDGVDNTGPLEFKGQRWMELGEFFTFIKSLSTYYIARDEGVELLNGGVVQDFTSAWAEDGDPKKLLTFPISLRIGKVGNSSCV